MGREYYHADPFDKKNNNYPLNWAKHDTTAWVKVYRNKQACEITIAVPLNMEFPESLEKQKATSLMQSWRIGIRIAWDNKYRVCCGVCSECPNGWAIRIDADFSFGSAHEKNNVVVKSPSKGGRANRGKWYTNSSNRTIAHEFGHWLGLPDEYGMTKNIDGSDLYDWGSNRDKRETGLMGENKPGQQGRLKRYFEMIIGDLKGYPCGGGDQPSYWLTESSGSCDR